jgi:hypothetical protein
VINQQAARLQSWVSALRPAAEGSPLAWLLHPCVPGLDVQPMVSACEVVLAELGWETQAGMAGRLYSAVAQPGTRAKAFVAGTDGGRLQAGRLAGASAIIFVLDTTPASLIKTYHQIKQLIGQRRDLAGHLGLLFTPPVGGGRQRLLDACRQFLDFTPTDLGTIPRFLSPDPGVEPHTQAPTPSSQTMNVWRQVVRRGLCGL